MFKAFRNKVFGIYVISILVLLVGSLTFVYVRSYREMESSIAQRLDAKKDGPQKEDNGLPDLSQDSRVPSEISESSQFDFDQARDLTIYQDDDFEQKLSDYVGEEYIIDYQNQMITSGSERYVFNASNGVYKVVRVTYDLEYIANLKTTLLIFGSLVLVLFSTFGFILITKLVAPLEASYQVQNQFVSDASHELKTPLAIIKSCLDLVARGDDDSENLVSYCQDETDRLIRLTSNLLQLSEHDQVDYQAINISKNIEILISGIEVNMFEHNIDFKTEIRPNIWAKVASDDINQLVHILIDNAVKYNDERKKVSLELTNHNRHLLLTVTNSSEIVLDSQLEHLFDRFYRVDKSRTEKGFGLGLALAKHLTTKYNGEIKADYSYGYFTINVKIPLT